MKLNKITFDIEINIKLPKDKSINTLKITLNIQMINWIENWCVFTEELTHLNPDLKSNKTVLYFINSRAIYNYF